jgi:subtilase family serine protease
VDALIAAQQNPESPLFHQWITPDQYAARFGMAQADLDKVQNWLLQQGFSVDWVARSRNMIRFSGSVSQVERAFSTEMHYFNAQGERHFAPSTDLQIPSALAPVVLAVRNLDNFRPKPQVVVHKDVQPRASFTSGSSGNHYFAPGDIVTTYDVQKLYNPGGFTGTGQSIAIAGQSAIAVTDIENFQGAAGLNIKDPTQVLVPGTGAAATYSNDETESDLDLEWSGAMAPGANIIFVFSGSSSTASIWDAIQYAVDEKLANIISISYGGCEPLLGTFSLETTFSQAVAQGQTIVAASGDQGSTACFVENPPKTGDPSLTIQEELAVNYPASSPNVTAVGGTEISAANDASGAGTYWNYTSGTDIIASAKSYIPEVAWNDDSSTSGLGATGGGVSTLFAKPTWQGTLTPADGHRDVPDISLYASGGYPGYLYCTSDSSSWSTGQVGSCTNGFRDSSSSGLLTVAGGTSFAAPIFAGMLALVNQQAGYITGSGNINPMLYKLATSGGAYSAGTIFHDTPSGSNNNCSAAGSTYCAGSGMSSYATAAGYDLVTGLGSIDLGNLASAWTASTSALVGTSTTISASNPAPAANASDTFTITVVAAGGAATPTGSVTLQIDGGTAHSGTTTTATLAASNTPGTATATYATSFTTAGAHQIVAQYPGDANFAASTGVVSVNVGGTSSGKGSFSVSASPSSLSVAQGSSGNETINIVPTGGYTGTVLLTLGASSADSAALTNLCYSFATTLNNGDGSVTVTGTSTVPTTLNFNTLPSSCGLAVPNKGSPQMRRLGGIKTAKNNSPNPAPMAIAFAGLLLIGFMGRYSRKLSALAGLAVLLAVGITVTACGGGGGGGGTTVTPDPPKGTYTITVTAQDSASSTIPTATTSFTFVIQ